jgi:molybdopterin/thiamine biosynthesis adenylyltransferase
MALLEAAGFRPDVDQEAMERGLARVTLSVPVEGIGTVAMIATFPDLYPYFRPEVAAPALDLAHHQHPFSKTLCLIGRSTSNWRPQDTLASLLSEQVDIAVAAGTAQPPSGPERDALPEEQQAEPYSDYYTYTPNVMVLIDGAWKIPATATHGTLTIRWRGPLPPPADDMEAHTLGVVSEIRDQNGSVLAAASSNLARFFGGDLTARWSRLAAPVQSNDARAVWETGSAADINEPPSTAVGSPRAPAVQVRAVVFPEEVSWRESGDGWVFVIRQPDVAMQVKGSKKRGVAAANKTIPGKHWLVRAGYAGPSDLAARAPELAGLAERHVVVVGAGALGSSIAVQLGRAGVGRLATIDRDTLDPGNNVRHAAPFLQSGRLKATAVSATVVDHSPYTASGFNPLAVGAIRSEARGISEGEALDNALDDAHLVIDATAEIAIQHLLADEARLRNLPYLCVTATNGGWGGMVTLIGPNTEGCWMCLLQHMSDGSIPIPPAAPSDFVQPPGCSTPTFTGTGFDLDHVSLHAVRVAVAALLGATPGGYPPPPHDVAVLTLREPDGTPTLPTWTGHHLSVHPDCPCH